MDAAAPQGGAPDGGIFADDFEDGHWDGYYSVRWARELADPCDSLVWLAQGFELDTEEGYAYAEDIARTYVLSAVGGRLILESSSPSNCTGLSNSERLVLSPVDEHSLQGEASATFFVGDGCVACAGRYEVQLERVSGLD